MLPIVLDASTQLRALAPSDADELYALIDADRERLARWLPWPPSQTLADTRTFIELTRGQAERGDGFQAAIEIDGALAGMAGFHAVDWPHRSSSIGYWLAQEHEGRGVMTRAVTALLAHAFGEWALNRVEVRVAPGNARSRAVVERLGFTEEGLLRQAERVGDSYLDNVVFSVLASEWPRSARPPV